MKKIKINLSYGGVMPEYKTKGAACADCYANTLDDLEIVKKGTRKTISLGFAIELPKGYEAIIRPRSGLTSKGIDIGIGTIDSDYRGEVKACVINNSDTDFGISHGDRICQIKIQKADKYKFVPVDKLSDTKRGSGGFGSTGV